MIYTYKPLYVSGILGSPHALALKFVESLPKFPRNNVISARDHASHLGDSFEAYDFGEHEDVVLKLFSKYLEGDVGQ